MHFKQIKFADPPEPFDVVVVIDVCRAFTSAAYALAGGAERIYLVSTVQDALDLKAANTGWRAMGESEGMPVDGFDYWNSPAELSQRDLQGVTLVQRTTAGTQGIAMWQGFSGPAPRIFAGSFVTAGATVEAVRALKPDSVGFVVTGFRPPRFAGEEDIACADYMQALLEGQDVDPQPYLLRALAWNRHQLSLDALREAQIIADLDLCLTVDKFDFAMPVRRIDSRMVLEAP